MPACLQLSLAILSLVAFTAWASHSLVQALLRRFNVIDLKR